MSLFYQEILVTIKKNERDTSFRYIFFFFFIGENAVVVTLLSTPGIFVPWYRDNARGHGVVDRSEAIPSIFSIEYHHIHKYALFFIIVIKRKFKNSTQMPI